MKKKETMKTSSEFLGESMVKLLNYRIEQEEYSSRLYLSMSLWANNKGYIGAGKLFKKYSEEELLHADKAVQLLLANGLQPITPALGEPEQDFENLPKAIKAGFKHETEITKQCYALTKAAYAEENYMVVELGLWYVKEQVEELDKFQTLLDRLDVFSDKADLLRELDEEMEEMASI